MVSLPAAVQVASAVADWFDFCDSCKSCLQGDWAEVDVMSFELQKAAARIIYTVEENGEILACNIPPLSQDLTDGNCRMSGKISASAQ